ncbi:ferritin-like protein [Burkholderia sp. BCC0397]|uniref:ferritin-like domain-containing protein n=1 Tax=Burkholderia sp. BCC0397 TaxID=486876 RepID=UPI001ABBD807|nr:ferritin-like protein [Burkholderia sp. BCC0397]
MKREKLELPREWTLPALQAHFQDALDLELWTIPYYLTVLYSIKDTGSKAAQLIQAAVYQEMLHAQLVANVANAYGFSPAATVPVYRGKAVPHLDFDLDEPNPTTEFTPYSAELGPLDAARINTMCLVEYPEWCTGREPDVADSTDEYGSIAEFYVALRYGMSALRSEVVGRRRQFDEFGPFYQNHPGLTVTEDGDAGFRQALTLLDVIVEQGEGQTEPMETVPVEFQNTADGFHNKTPHFQRFDFIRNLPVLPATYPGVANPPAGSPGHDAQQILIRDFAAFLDVLNRMFRGEAPPPSFGSLMAKLGGDILSCWKHQAIPRFSQEQA